MRWNIYRKMLLFATLMIVLPVSLLGFLTYRESEAMLVGRIKQASLLIMENAANNFIKNYIKDVETAARILSSDLLLNEPDRRQQLLEIWEQRRRYSNHIRSIRYAGAQGDFLIAPLWDSPADYNPRDSDWYRQAGSAGAIRWSEPHVAPPANNTVVTATKAVYRNGELQGILAIDTSLSDLSAIIGSINLGSGGYLILLDAGGNIIAHREQALLGTNVRDTAWFKQLAGAGFASTRLEDIYVCAVTIPDTDWILVGFLPETMLHIDAAPLKYMTIVVALLGIFLASLASVLVSRGFVARIKRLVESMDRIEQGDYSKPAEDISTDEIGELSRKFRVMADTLSLLMEQRDLTEAELRRQKGYFAQLFENSPESIAILDSTDKILAVNKQFADLFQYGEDEARGVTIDDLVVPPALREKGLHVGEVMGSVKFVQAETVRRRKDGSMVDVQVIAYPIIVADCPVGTYVIYRDISERKAAERALEYLTYHDALTGVYNRRYFDHRIEQLAGSEKCGVLVFDVDGLKLVNDTFGHAKGDELLKTSALLIKEASPSQAIIARMGGDEFGLLLPQATVSDLQELVQNLRNRIAEFNGATPDFAVSLSMGFSLAEQESGIAEALQEADSRMYKEKLHRSQSTRSTIVRTLMQALYARDFITEGHGERIQLMVVKLALRLGLANFRIQDLRLFSQFHDLGKVGIPDGVLFKPGPLDPKEMEVMRRHSEIGYRIAISSPELNHIAEWILKHHEWWNGQGYPIGLSGAEIPVECRILAICDAYDAMVSGRPYRQALDAAAALAEIERNSGSMFDPDIVAVFVSMVREGLAEQSHNE
ncbi:diguanylate cyclase|uniref:PAS domain S-box-containing protein/diguanylate cyclase (GGDEF) domain-containing protein n=1 Tax=Dendrosporobacter quercicolus TaxID=146817 RepID=A0A1G9U3V5_9FIRM|nr:HD domain-containing phosphohydrolase [Dendrosporobacter quercicolus]NSL48764.1 diguanylate cyclase [Dendrosporobacter quercicolus DSM 1736]SDM54637.1 PAS domain S-box-containing protein/diguanylate cyclase (GGDEF) domain-containing protein [Dendrosporobacter quercicolus]